MIMQVWNGDLGSTKEGDSSREEGVGKAGKAEREEMAELILKYIQ